MFCFFYHISSKMFTRLSVIFSTSRFDVVFDGVGGDTEEWAMGLLKPWSGAKYVTLVTPLLLNTDSMGLLDGTLNAGFSLQSKAIQVNTSKTDFWFKQKWMYTKKASIEVVYFCNMVWGLFFSLRRYSGCGLPVLPNWSVILDPQWHGKKTWIFLFHSVDYMDWSWGDTGRGKSQVMTWLSVTVNSCTACIFSYVCMCCVQVKME